MPDHSDEILLKIIDRIVALPSDGKGGVKLPTERILAADLDIQRQTVRERLATLETLGFIKRTQGKGTYLTLARSSVIRIFFDIALRLGGITIKEMQNTMEMIVRESAATAATSASLESVRALSDLLDGIPPEDSLEALVKAQHEFLFQLVRASGNPVTILLFEGIAAVVYEVLRRRLRVLRQLEGSAERNLDARRNVVEAVQSREPDAARAAVEEYFWLWRREEAKISSLSFA